MNLSKGIRASVVRLGFLTHGMIGLFGLVHTTQISTYWFIGVTMLLLMMEIILTYRLNEKGEWKWFIPSAFIYLSTVVPVIWLLELAMFDFRVELQTRLGVATCPIAIDDYIRDHHRNVTILVSDNTTNLEEVQNSSREFYSTTLQQTLMLVLILGRWFQPRGDLTRDQLSQLLLVYIGMAADMLEFSSETLRIDEIACNWPMFIVILAIWSWSLTQFTLGLTATKGRKTRASGNMPGNDHKTPTPSPSSSPSKSFDSLEMNTLQSSKVKVGFLSGICGTELWALLISLLIQDGPFLITRLYIIFYFNVYDRSMLFFTCKNGLLLFLMFYRLFVVIRAARKVQRSKLLRLRARTQPAGQDKQGSIKPDRVSNSSRNNRIIDPDKTPEVVINMPSSNENMAVYRSERDMSEDGNDLIYQMPPDEQRESIEDGQLTSDADDEARGRNGMAYQMSPEESGGHDNQAYQHDQDSSDEDFNDFSEDNEYDDEVRDGAYVVSVQESDDNTVSRNPPKPSPLAPPAPPSSLRGTSVTSLSNPKSSVTSLSPKDISVTSPPTPPPLPPPVSSSSSRAGRSATSPSTPPPLPPSLPASSSIDTSATSRRNRALSSSKLTEGSDHHSSSDNSIYAIVRRQPKKKQETELTKLTRL